MVIPWVPVQCSVLFCAQLGFGVSIWVVSVVGSVSSILTGTAGSLLLTMGFILNITFCVCNCTARMGLPVWTGARCGLWGGYVIDEVRGPHGWVPRSQEWYSGNVRTWICRGDTVSYFRLPANRVVRSKELNLYIEPCMTNHSTIQSINFISPWAVLIWMIVVVV